MLEARSQALEVDSAEKSPRSCPAERDKNVVPNPAQFYRPRVFSAYRNHFNPIVSIAFAREECLYFIFNEL